MLNYLTRAKQYKKYPYNQIPKQKLEYLQNRTLEMFNEIVKVFNENKIEYMLCGGTLLGAVTTNKFIPWDDDIDICVFDRDYERARTLLINNLNDTMIVQCKETEDNYYHNWIKVRDKKSKVFPNEIVYKNNGVWVDIYRILETKKKKTNILITKNHLNYLLERSKTNSISKLELAKRIIINHLLIRYLINYLYSVISKNNTKEYVIMSASKIKINENWVFPLKKYFFMGKEYTSFNKANEYLVNHYGNNYNTIPKESDRRISLKDIYIYIYKFKRIKLFPYSGACLL